MEWIKPFTFLFMFTAPVKMRLEFLYFTTHVNTDPFLKPYLYILRSVLQFKLNSGETSNAAPYSAFL